MSTDLHWIKSSYSSEQGGNCVEVATRPDSIHVRDSKDTSLPSFEVSPAAWGAFVSTV
ncbi:MULTISPECIES: DUF397 domain-containing protein [Streptomyces]|uniref:DUF397 domain-containing protein n=1 Tax=Streptomyces nymphaeiformis TaxID=2663842 RepID=A0A7W7XFE6_9ACTN|nr:DUF397 domain-containing protein [Streptomyces nymphaeiformis]MBB4986132.1 hypothetical protein [Streptomyces nymphaeiformis]